MMISQENFVENVGLNIEAFNASCVHQQFEVKAKHMCGYRSGVALKVVFFNDFIEIENEPVEFRIHIFRGVRGTLVTRNHIVTRQKFFFSINNKKLFFSSSL